MRAYNSTIKIKEKICIRCGKPCYWFSKKRCQSCARIEDTLSKADQDNVGEDGLPELIKELDDLISRYLRLKNADKNGNVKCYTCDTVKPIGEMQAGHYIPRGCMLLRYDIDRNLRCQCKDCNEYKRGNLSVYGQRLEEEMTGITEILLSESYTVYKYTREELKAMILDYSKRIKQLMK